jgi:hypothetical protein
MEFRTKINGQFDETTMELHVDPETNYTWAIRNPSFGNSSLIQIEFDRKLK